MNKIICFILGIICLILGFIGLLLPIVPQIPFLVAGVLLLMSSSERFYNWFESTDVYKKHIKKHVKNHKKLQRFLEHNKSDKKPHSEKKKKSKKTYEKKAGRKNGIKRAIFTSLCIIAEFGVLFAVFVSGLDRYGEAIAVISRIVAFLLVLALYSQNRSSSLKMPWIVLILIFPAAGVSLYLLLGLSGTTKRMKKRYEQIDAKIFPYLRQSEDVFAELKERYPYHSNISAYLMNQIGYPVYRDEGTTYYKDVSEAFEAIKESLHNAKKFIFMEYFAIEDAESWQEIEEILVKKADEGVEVRVFYDDIGSIAFINTDFVKKLKSKGIRCRVFNPMLPVVNLFLNNRDHRKMTVVDGETGFTGGYNIANEYFNISSPYGHWKDAGIRIKGEVVNAMTLTFLEMWNAVRGGEVNDSDLNLFLTDKSVDKRGITECKKGFVQFYADNPMDKKPVGEDVYISMIESATEYIYIMTPYLIITDEMNHALTLSAKRGVDVRIITPGIPDKKIIYRLTRSYYGNLAKNGVRIYEYTPGFCHAKLCVTDDKAATCGTINFDYRSLYYHFENGYFMIGTEQVAEIKKDFMETFPVCKEVTEKYAFGRSAGMRFGQLVLRLFAPMM